MAATNRDFRAESLGPARELALPQGALRYHSVGSGPTRRLRPRRARQREPVAQRRRRAQRRLPLRHARPAVRLARRPDAARTPTSPRPPWPT